MLQFQTSFKSMKATEYLEQLGLSAEEASLYLTLLETGATSIRELAKKIGIKRTTAYLYVDKLTEKGLVTKIVKGSRAQVEANTPEECLRPFVDEKLRTAKEIQNTFTQALQTFPTPPQRQMTEEVNIKYYKGKNGVRKIYEEALKAKEVRSYVNLSEMGGLFPENSDIFINAFKQNLELKLFEIFEDSSQSKIAIQNQATNKRFFYKFHPKEITLSAADTLIFNGCVGIINVHNDRISGIILKNTEYYNNLKEFFDFIWKMLPEAK